jgi:polyisoprenyl-teichoic acid--peptidoglycan teichoic acid transferase
VLQDKEDAMSRKRKLILLAVMAVVLLLCTCAGSIGYLAINTALGPTLQIETQMASPIPGTSSIEYWPTAIPIPSPTPEEAVNCGMKGSMNILIMGVDSPFGDGFKGTLAIRLVKVDFARKSANVFSFPRDLWIPVTGLENYGITQAHLGELYLIAKSNAGYSEAAATNLVAQNLYQNFGAFSDHYIVGKMATLAAIIDTVDGITIPIPRVHDATPYGMHYFPAGPYPMKGLLALEYAISPTSAGQWDGFDRQTLVLHTLFQKILSPDILPKLPTLIPQFLQVATTDLSLQQMLNLLCISQQIPRERTVFDGIEPGDVSIGAGGVLYPNTDVIRAKVLQNLSPE